MSFVQFINFFSRSCLIIFTGQDAELGKLRQRLTRLENNSRYRKRRRGAHRNFQETRYTNQSFKYANELKMLNRIKSEVPESVINEINPEVIKVAQSNLLKRREK